MGLISGLTARGHYLGSYPDGCRISRTSLEVARAFALLAERSDMPTLRIEHAAVP